MKSDLFLELLGGFEPPTSSLPTDWEGGVCCFRALLCPLRFRVPSFPALLCPLFPPAHFPVWVTVWVSGKEPERDYSKFAGLQTRRMCFTSPMQTNGAHCRTPGGLISGSPLFPRDSGYIPLACGRPLLTSGAIL